MCVSVNSFCLYLVLRQLGQPQAEAKESAATENGWMEALHVLVFSTLGLRSRGDFLK